MPEPNFKVLVSFSGGKDSLASLLHIWFNSKFPRECIEAVFCDTGHEHEWTYDHINYICTTLGVRLVVLKSKKYDSLIDLARKKGRFPSATRRFCTTELKVKPMIDYILDECKCHVLIVQGIRKDESAARSMMSANCTFFQHYFSPPVSVSGNSLPTHSYRKDDIVQFRQEFTDDVIRPVFDWSGDQVINFILSHNFKPNPLYYTGARRVGCYPCVMCGLGELKFIIDNDPRYIERLVHAEAEIGSSFFPPNYIPDRAMSLVNIASGKPVPTVKDVVKYVGDRNATGDLFADQPSETPKCVSYYSLCE